MRLKFFLIWIVVFSLFHSKVTACVSYYYSELIYWQAPPYIDPNYFQLGRALDVILEKYFHKTPPEAENQNKMTFKGYQEKIKDLEKSKNLTSLISTQPQEPSVLEYGRCQSNTYESALGFLKAAFSDSQVKEGYQDLIQLRYDMLFFCGEQMKESTLLTRIQSLDEKKVGGYKQYLEATFYFYAQEYEKALEIYSVLKKGGPSSLFDVFHFFTNTSHLNWLKETAAYMEARTLLILSQKNWDGMGPSEGNAIDKDMLLRSLKLFQEYLKEYPKGLYSNSAKNIQRKIFLLLEDQKQLNESLRDAVNRQLAAIEKGEKFENNPSQVFEIMSEFKHYFKGEINPAVDSPLIIAFDVLGRTTSSKSLLSVLEREEKRFAPYPGLYQFLRAWVLYKLGLFQEVLEVAPNSSSSSPKDMLAMSLGVLRARSLRALNKNDEALKILKDMELHMDEDLRQHVQLEMVCLQFERGHKFDLFLTATPLNPELFNDVVTFGFSDEELNQLLENSRIKGDLRSKLTQTLMERYLVMGRLKDARTLYEKADQQHLGRFMPLKPYVINLISSPQDKKGLVEFGKLLFELALYPLEEARVSDTLIGLKEHCQSCHCNKNATMFQTRVNFKDSTPPFEYFLKVIQSADEKKKSDLEAEALHYLVAKCFHGHYDRYNCQWGKEFKNKSLEWFRRLHKKYKGTTWADQTPYYY